MKPNKKLFLLFPAIVTALLNFNSKIIVAQGGPSGPAKIYSAKTYTFKNTNLQITANDLHLRFITHDSINEDVIDASSVTFTNPPTGQGTPVVTWSSGGDVPPGIKDKVVITNEDDDFVIFPDSCYFTNNGVMIPNALSIVACDIQSNNFGKCKVKNPPNSPPLFFHDLSVFKNNLSSNFRIDSGAFVYETPSGSLVYSNTNFTLNSGDSIMINLGTLDTSGYILTTANISSLSSPTDVYFVAAATRQPSPIPTLSEWGKILLVILLLGFGLYFIRRS